MANAFDRLVNQDDLTEVFSVFFYFVKPPRLPWNDSPRQPAGAFCHPSQVCAHKLNNQTSADLQQHLAWDYLPFAPIR